MMDRLRKCKQITCDFLNLCKGGKSAFSQEHLKPLPFVPAERGSRLGSGERGEGLRRLQATEGGFITLSNEILHEDAGLKKAFFSFRGSSFKEVQPFQKNLHQLVA
jgi:hypothetical protein